MRDILDYLDNWLGKGEKVALATVVQTWGSSPRGVGAKMALTPSGKIAGSVSGGCVEGAVFEAGVETLRSGRPQRLHFGVADETAWQVGLACGGQVDVFVQPLDENVYPLLHNKVVSGQPFATLTVIGGPDELVGKVMLVENERRLPGSVPPGLEDVLWETGRRRLADRPFEAGRTARAGRVRGSGGAAALAGDRRRSAHRHGADRAGAHDGIPDHRDRPTQRLRQQPALPGRGPDDPGLAR